MDSITLESNGIHTTIGFKEGVVENKFTLNKTILEFKGYVVRVASIINLTPVHSYLLSNDDIKRLLCKLGINISIASSWTYTIKAGDSNWFNFLLYEAFRMHVWYKEHPGDVIKI